MTVFTNGKRAPDRGLIETGVSAGSSTGSAQGPSGSKRYYFNITNGETMIRDEEGVEASSIQAAVVSALEALEELRVQDPLHSDEWQGWRLEIVDATGQAVQIIPLDALSPH